MKDERVRTEQHYASLKVKWSRLYSHNIVVGFVALIKFQSVFFVVVKY